MAGQCPWCGSNLITLLTDDIMICLNCGVEWIQQAARILGKILARFIR